MTREATPILWDENLTALWLDGFALGTRGDEVITFSGLQQYPDNHVREKVRIIMSRDQARQMIVALMEAVGDKEEAPQLLASES